MTVARLVKFDMITDHKHTNKLSRLILQRDVHY